MRRSSIIGRFAETKEVANLVVFLCDEGSSAALQNSDSNQCPMTC